MQGKPWFYVGCKEWFHPDCVNIPKKYLSKKCSIVIFVKAVLHKHLSQYHLYTWSSVIKVLTNNVPDAECII